MDFESLCPFESADSTDADGAQIVGQKNVAFRRLVDLIKSILGRPLDFDIRFKVKPEAVSASKLGTARLGFDSWVISEPSKDFRDDTVKRYAWDMTN
jgi:predicted component of type VI protein secretion system